MRGTKSIQYKSSKDNRISNYYKELIDYENNKGWLNKDFDYNRIYKHADWNGSNHGWLGLRSMMRQIPNNINWKDVDNSDYYNSPNEYRDSLMNIYLPKFD